ncbi:MAG: division/cell wall cluster transcriptional repressor MraZ [Saccharofermentanales bacterium]|jgi:MraZ protein|nr:division/cell wall cluster transcriptional repressor MraZ [Clostridiaceae bacterium]
MARFTHIIDAKGRVFVPARLRESIGGSLIVTLSLDDGYLSAYTPENFRGIRDQINQLSGTDPAVRRFKRAILGEAMVCELDSQGRISISEELWSHIQVKPGEEICFIDMFDKLEICSKAFYQQQKEEQGSLSEVDLSRFDVKGI